ncbi:UNVERIFIED_CONTAM: hypothetical protein K2H54_040091 [Gekko kuhli]
MESNQPTSFYAQFTGAEFFSPRNFFPYGGGGEEKSFREHKARSLSSACCPRHSCPSFSSQNFSKSQLLEHFGEWQKRPAVQLDLNRSDSPNHTSLCSYGLPNIPIERFAHHPF